MATQRQAILAMPGGVAPADRELVAPGPDGFAADHQGKCAPRGTADSGPSGRETLGLRRILRNAAAANATISAPNGLGAPDVTFTVPVPHRLQREALLGHALL